MCTKWMVHIFNVWTIIRQSLNIKESKLLELFRLHKPDTIQAFWTEKFLSSTPLKNEKYS